MRLTQREKTIFFICLATIFGYLTYIGIFIPMENKRSDLQRKLLVSEKELQRDIATINRGKAYYSEYENLMSRYHQKQSDEEVMSAILSEIEKVASGFEMRITQMKPKKVKRIDFHNNFAVNLTIDGNINDIIQFLHILQFDPHLFTVESLRFNKQSPRRSTLRCQLVLNKILIP